MIRPLVTMTAQSRDAASSPYKAFKHLGLFVDLSTNNCGPNSIFV
jgi:hypothetical protein